VLEIQWALGLALELPTELGPEVETNLDMDMGSNSKDWEPQSERPPTLPRALPEAPMALALRRQDQFQLRPKQWLCSESP